MCKLKSQNTQYSYDVPKLSGGNAKRQARLLNAVDRSMHESLKSYANYMLNRLLEGPEPTPNLIPFEQDHWSTYGGAEVPGQTAGGLQERPLIGEITLEDGVEGVVIVDKTSVQVVATVDEEDQVFMFQTPFTQGKGIAANIIRIRPSLQRLVSEFGFEQII